MGRGDWKNIDKPPISCMIYILFIKEDVHINLKVNIFTPGLYDIGRFKITFYLNKINMKTVSPVTYN